MENKVTITIETGNSAFADNPHLEVARILKVMANVLEDGAEPRRAVDINGNVVGTVTYE